MIPARAIEAAQEAVKDAMIEHGPDGHIDGYEEITRSALEAAAPHILAEAFHELARAYMAENADINQIDGTPVATQEQWRFYHWLSLRAAAERSQP